MARAKKTSTPPVSDSSESTSQTIAANGIVLEGELTIYQVGSLKPVLLEALHYAKAKQIPVHIDMSAVSECDGAGLQLLLALSKTAQATDTLVELHNTQANIAAMLDSYGVAKYFTSHSSEVTQ